MSTYRETRNFLGDSKPADASKYNLRCNRNISEKMTKKDFVYDIRPPIPASRKGEEERRHPIVLPLQLRRKLSTDSRIPRYTVIPAMNDREKPDDTIIFTEQRPLGFECNLCRQPIATLNSLSTHVKFHCQRYCRTCYWILQNNETMEEHIESFHPVDLGITSSR